MDFALHIQRCLQILQPHQNEIQIYFDTLKAQMAKLIHFACINTFDAKDEFGRVPSPPVKHQIRVPCHVSFFLFSAYFLCFLDSHKAPNLQVDCINAEPSILYCEEADITQHVTIIVLQKVVIVTLSAWPIAQLITVYSAFAATIQ